MSTNNSTLTILPDDTRIVEVVLPYHTPRKVFGVWSKVYPKETVVLINTNRTRVWDTTYELRKRRPRRATPAPVRIPQELYDVLSAYEIELTAALGTLYKIAERPLLPKHIVPKEILRMFAEKYGIDIDVLSILCIAISKLATKQLQATRNDCRDRWMSIREVLSMDKPIQERTTYAPHKPRPKRKDCK